jgi:hypothetical protein
VFSADKLAENTIITNLIDNIFSTAVKINNIIEKCFFLFALIGLIIVTLSFQKLSFQYFVNTMTLFFIIYTIYLIFVSTFATLLLISQYKLSISSETDNQKDNIICLTA